MALITFSGMKPVATPYRPTNSSNSQKGGYRESGDHFAPRFGGVTAASSDAQLDKNALGKYIFSLYQHCSRGEYEQAVGKVQAWKDTHPDFIKRARKRNTGSTVSGWFDAVRRSLVEERVPNGTESFSCTCC